MFRWGCWRRSYTFERQEKRETKYVGRGRGNVNRPTREIVSVRYQVLAVTRQETAIATHQKTLGWRVYVSGAPAGQLNLVQAVLTYRGEWIIEFVVRRNLKQNKEKLAGLIENNPRKGIHNPTTERLLKAFDEITLTTVRLPDRIIQHVTPLTTVQTRILHWLGLSAAVYTRLVEN